LVARLTKSLSQNPVGGCQRPRKLALPNGFGTCSKKCRVDNKKHEKYYGSSNHHYNSSFGPHLSVSRGSEGVGFEHHFGDREIHDDAMGQTALVDLDRDGDLDFITGKRAGPIFWYEYQSADRWVKHILGQESPSEVGGAALDVDQDGWVDFVTGGVWYRNLGNPKESGFARHTFDKNLASVHDLIIGDLDGDGAISTSVQNSGGQIPKMPMVARTISTILRIRLGESYPKRTVLVSSSCPVRTVSGP